MFVHATATPSSERLRHLFVVDRPDMITCADGRQVAGSATYQWDDSLTGIGTVANRGECGDAPGLISNPFTLTGVA